MLRQNLLPPPKKELQLSFELWKTANLVLAYESIVGVITVILSVPPESLVKIHMDVRLSSWLAINKIIESHCSTLCKDEFTELARGFLSNLAMPWFKYIELI